MKKVKLNSFMLSESSVLSANQKKVVMGGFWTDECPDMGQRCGCPEGGSVYPISPCGHDCPPECPLHLYV